MWVLDARYKAEKVWYAIIWEEAKENSNVIDYNIQEEITKDKSAVFNANNDTTTGMATVIPWVNAPKLIAQTSIVWIDFNAGLRGSIKYRLRWEQLRLEDGDNAYEELWIYVSESNARWPYKFEYITWKWIVIPAQWAYELVCDFFYVWGNGSSMNRKYDTLLDWNIVHSTSYVTATITETFTINAYKWQSITFMCDITNNSWITIGNATPYVDAKITKL